jgi:hypothetical protein
LFPGSARVSPAVGRGVQLRLDGISPHRLVSNVERFITARIERLILHAAGYTFLGPRCKELFQLALARQMRRQWVDKVARTLVPGLLTLACLLVAAPATAQVNYAISGNTAYVTSSPNASGAIVIASLQRLSRRQHRVWGVFSRCTNLTSVTIPNSLTSIGQPAFLGCTSLTNLSVNAANRAYSSLNGVLFNKAQTTLIIFPPGRGSCVIPDSLFAIKFVTPSLVSASFIVILGSEG